jgi:prepilin-type N-terminal cleavage/methylation domain-containing protein
MLGRSPSRRPAFTLAEVLVAVALIAVLAAVLVPTVRGKLQDSYENAIISEFDNLASAITAYRQDVGKYPPHIDELVLLRTSTPSTDRCGNALTTTAKANWRGPYITRPVSVSTSYLFASKDTVKDSLFVNGTPRGIHIEMYGPDTVTAHNIDVKIDGVANAGTGQLQWDMNVSGGNTDAIVKYVIPTKSGAC